MKKLIIGYKTYILKVHISETCTSILKSYRIKNSIDMKNILESIKKEVSTDMAINKRSIKGMVREWRVHNLLYSLNIMKDRTGTVDLEINQSWYMKTLYSILSIFYLP